MGNTYIGLTPCYRLSVCASVPPCPDSYVESLILNVWVFGDGPLGDYQLMRVGPSWTGFLPLWRDMKRWSLSLSPPCEVTARRSLSAHQKESSPQEPGVPALWSGTSHPPKLWEIKICCLIHQVCGILLQRLELTEAMDGTTLKWRHSWRRGWRWFLTRMSLWCTRTNPNLHECKIITVAILL